MALEWVRAGHDPAVYFNASGNSLTYLDGPGAALGVEEGMDYQSGSLAGPAPGDIILIGTDGIWETPGEALTPFGKERVEAVVRRHHRDTAATILEAVLGELAAFRGKKRQEDDITLVVVKVGGPD
jgi:sigma-B regulation protein RsbU (phosphoserine phosphatase)